MKPHTASKGSERSIPILTDCLTAEQTLKGPPNKFYFENVKKTNQYLLKFLFLSESTILPVNNSGEKMLDGGFNITLAACI